MKKLLLGVIGLAMGTSLRANIVLDILYLKKKKMKGR
jgi:hypothetical protein